MADSRTFRIRAPHMKGEDVRAWQKWLLDQFHGWGIDYPIKADGDYGVATRDATASMCMAMGLASAGEAMAEGVTPALRTKLRNRDLTPAEDARMDARTEYRAALRRRYDDGGSTHTPVAKILGDSWGYHPGVHDGEDLICPPNATLFAICDGEVVRADSGGWWGLGAPADPALRGRGDGIIIVRSSTDAGPFKPGLNLCYGHAEHPNVRVGQKVRAGAEIGKAGFANAWHVHFMVNGRHDDRGVGDRDPRPYIDYARSHT